MAYTDEEDASFLVTAFTFGAASKTGIIGSTTQRIINRVPMMAGGNVNPIARPAGMIDARVVARFYDLGDDDAVSAAAANCTTSHQAADGVGTGSVEYGPMVPNNVDVIQDHATGQNVIEAEYLHKGSALTETITI